jgi:DNA processing protein
LNKSNLQYQIALTFLHGIGPKKASVLASKLGSIEAVFHEKYTLIHQITGIGQTVLKEMNREKAFDLAQDQVTYIEKNKINTHFYLNANYPRRLKQCDDAPILLYSKGNFDPNPTKVISIVGTRNATEYGRNLCEELIDSLRDKDIQVVSGMAYGIDICAHQLCVKNNIQTVGVLGHGLDRLYPRIHNRTAEHMFNNGGLLTEFIPGTNPDRENFPMRNRIVAGMSDATIVVESKKTGGSLITADLANDYNRDVFAFPGNVGQQFSEGCNLLIQKQKAHLIMNGTDFLNQMNWNERSKKTSAQRSCFTELTDDEKPICEILEGSNGEHIDVLSMRTGFPVSKINVLLFHLEMKGVLRTLPGKKYSLI